MPDPVADNPTPEAPKPTDDGGNGETPKPPADEDFQSEGSKQSVLADLMKERETRKAAEAKLKEIEDAQLSELERAKKDAETSAAELAQLRTENIRANVALAKGVPADLVEFLTGANEEEIKAKADTLLARLNAPTSPKPDPSQGPSGDKPKQSTAAAFAEQLADF